MQLELDADLAKQHMTGHVMILQCLECEGGCDSITVAQIKYADNTLTTLTALEVVPESSQQLWVWRRKANARRKRPCKLPPSLDLLDALSKHERQHRATAANTAAKQKKKPDVDAHGMQAGGEEHAEEQDGMQTDVGEEAEELAMYEQAHLAGSESDVPDASEPEDMPETRPASASTAVAQPSASPAEPPAQPPACSAEPPAQPPVQPAASSAGPPGPPPGQLTARQRAKEAVAAHLRDVLQESNFCMLAPREQANEAPRRVERGGGVFWGSRG